MSTRSAVIIAQPYNDTSLHLYRHSDGYPALAGAAIVDACRNATCEEQVAAHLLSMTYEGRSERRLTAVYHVTPHAFNHGDLEYLYQVYHAPTLGGWRVKVSVRPNWQDGDDMTTWPTSDYSLPEFVTLVNEDRQATNRRIATLRAEHPTRFADTEDYPMLATA